MSVVSVKEIAVRGGQFDEKGEREYTRTFRVRTNSSYDSVVTVANALGLPRRGDVFTSGSGEADLGAICQKIKPKQDQSDYLTWLVDCEYSSRQDTKTENPLDRPAEISCGFTQFSRIVERDIDGQAILNSAGQYFDPPIEADDSRPTLTIQRNEQFFSFALAMDYQDAVNQNDWFGFPAGTVKVAGITARRQFENGMYFWPVGYEFHIRREGWAKEILDQGRYQKSSPPGDEPEKILDNQGQHVTDPVQLDGEGRAVANPSISTAHFLTFHVYKRRDFGDLQLP